MRKIRLSFDELQVESFATQAYPAPSLGTVRGARWQDQDSNADCTDTTLNDPPTAGDTCGASCYGCTNYGSCPMTCDVSCQGSACAGCSEVYTGCC
jgi:hypothetical protein